MSDKVFIIILLLFVVIIFQQWQIRKIANNQKTNDNAAPSGNLFRTFFNWIVQKFRNLRIWDFIASLFGISGRIGRGKYFVSQLIVFVFSFYFYFCYYMTNGFDTFHQHGPSFYLICFSGLLSLAIAFCINISCIERRWHDMGHSGAFLFVNLILSSILWPYGYILSELIMLGTPGDKVANKYGEPPL